MFQSVGQMLCAPKTFLLTLSPMPLVLLSGSFTDFVSLELIPHDFWSFFRAAHYQPADCVLSQPCFNFVLKTFGLKFIHPMFCGCDFLPISLHFMNCAMPRSSIACEIPPHFVLWLIVIESKDVPSRKKIQTTETCWWTSDSQHKKDNQNNKMERRIL
jgi:hypothetical protein